MHDPGQSGGYKKRRSMGGSVVEGRLSGRQAAGRDSGFLNVNKVKEKAAGMNACRFRPQREDFSGEVGRKGD
jgi:hypothetical protein